LQLLVELIMLEFGEFEVVFGQLQGKQGRYEGGRTGDTGTASKE
jgi:hypothetical protein